jgi:hypothetical protein
MSYSDRAQALAGLIQSLPDAGVVHPRVRLVNEWSKYIRLFQAPDGRINGWEITRRAAGPWKELWSESWQIRRYFGIRDQDETGPLFQQSLDAAVKLFWENSQLSFGTLLSELRIVEADERMFGDVLCHYAECELITLMDYEEL